MPLLFIEGTNHLFVRQTDSAGNTSASSTLTFTLDSEISPLNISADQGALSITGKEDSAFIEYSSDGETWNNTYELMEGSNTLHFRQTDAAGNISDSTTLTFNVDRMAQVPDIALANDTGITNDLITSDGQLLIEGIEDDAIVEYSTNGVDWSTRFTPAEGENTVYIRQTDTSGNASGTASLTFYLDTESATVSPEQTFSYVENQTAGSGVGSFVANDNSGIVSYQFYNNGTPSALSADGYYAITANGDLSLTEAGLAAGANDYETGSNRYRYDIITTDVAGNVSAPVSVILNVTNTVENTAPVLGADDSITILENTTQVGNYAATDVNDDQISYSLSGDDATLFTIDANGNLSFKSAPDFDTNPGPFDVIITATDDGEGQLSDSQTIRVSVSNEIENTAPVLGADDSTTIPENTTQVGNYAATDVNNDQISYSLSGDDAGLFTIDANGNLSFKSAPDFDTNAGPFDVIITATDDGEGQLSDSQKIRVSVSNEIENTAPVLGANDSITIPENTTQVGNYAATDVNNDQISYSISGDDATLFTIDANGNLSFKSAPDFDTNPGPFDVTVTATDDGEGQLSDSKSLIVTVIPDPVVPIDIPVLALHNDSGFSDTDKITNDGALLVSGIEEDARVEFRINGGAWQTTGFENGVLQDFNARHGSNSVEVRQQNVDGVYSNTSQPLTFTLDTSNPSSLTVELALN